MSGATGFIGSAITKSLGEAGHEVVALSRSGHPGTVRWDPPRRTTEVDGAVDAIVHLAGESIGGRWTPSKKRRLMDSRLDGTATMAQLAIDKGVSHLLTGSAIGFYGSRGDSELTEDTPSGVGFLADLTVAWEQAAAPAVEAAIPTAYLRTSLVLDRTGGSFPRMLMPFKFGVGGRIGSGEQWWSWISLRDEVRAIVHILNAGLTGPVNLCAEPVLNAEFTKTLGEVMGRPSLVPAPSFGLRLLLGSEFAEEVLLASQRVVPQVLRSSGFEFADAELRSGLEAVLAGDDR